MLSYGASTTISSDESFEPDEKWKAALKYRINKEAESMFAEARKTFNDKMPEVVIHADARDRMKDEYMEVMASLQEVANEQYEIELQAERDHRRKVYLTTMTTLPKRAQETTIENGRSLNSNSDDELQVERQAARRSSKSSSDSPANIPREGAQLASARRAPAASGDHNPPAEPSSLRPKRRTSDAQKSVDKQEEARSVPHRQRPRLSGVFDEQVEESKSPRSRQSTAEPPSSAPPTDRPWDSSLGKSAGGSIRSSSERHNARSPPTVEYRRGSAPPPDDLVPPTKPFTQVHRRGSTASMRSTGSGASVRPMTETILERTDDFTDDDQSRGDRQGHDRSPRKAGGKARERRRDSRPTPVDPLLRHEDSMSSVASVRSTASSSATMQYAISPSYNKSVSSISTSTSMDDRYFTSKPIHSEPRDIDERRHPADRPSKPNPYVDPRDAHIPVGYPHREGYSPRDPPPPVSRPPPPRSPYQSDDREYNPSLPRPVPPRSPYNPDDYPPRDPGLRPSLPRSPYDDRDYGSSRDMHVHPPHGPPPPRNQYSMDDRDYSGQYSNANGRHTGPPKSPAFLNDRDYSSSPQSSYSYDDPRRREHGQWDRQPAWNDDRDHRDYGRDREREAYTDSRGPVHPQYSRGPAYPTAPPEQSRGPQDYHANGYDDRDAQVPPRGYSRSDNARPNLPSRQPSYTRRDTPDRRTENEPESYPPRQYYSPIENNYAPPELPATPAWQKWKSDTRPPPPHMQRLVDPSYPHSPPPNGQQFATPYSQRSRRSHRHRRDPASPSDPDSPLLDDTDPDEHSDSEGDEESRDTSFSRSQSGTDEGDDADEEADDSDAHARRKMHENTRQIKEQKRELDALAQAEDDAARTAREKEKEMQRMEDVFRRKQEAKRNEDETRRKEEARKAEAAQRRKEKEAKEREEDELRRAEEIRAKAEEEARQRAEEARIKEEELKRKEEEARRIKEEAIEKAEEARRKEEEARLLKEQVAKEEALAKQKHEQAERKAAMLKQKEIEAQRKETEVSKREKDALKQKEEAQKLQEDARRKADEAKRKEREVKRKEKEAREKEEALKREGEEMRKLAQLAQQEQEKAQQEQEKLRALIASAEERERLLAIREAEVKEREETAQRLATEAQEREAEAEALKRKEEEEEARRKQEEEDAAEARRKQEEEEDAERRRKEVEEAESKRKKEEELVRKARDRARAKHEDEKREAKRKEELARQEAQAAEDNARRASEAKAEDVDDIITEEHLNDPEFVQRQAFIFQQVKYQQRAEDILRRTRGDQRTRNDSIGNDNLSSSPGNTSSMPRAPPPPSQPPPQHHYNHPPTYPTPPAGPSSSAEQQIPRFDHPQSTSSGNYSPSNERERSSGGSGAWSSSMKNPPSSSNTRPSTGIPFQSKPSPTTPYPSGASPSTQSPISEEERARRQAEFVRQQQEWFRRDQEQKEADVQMRRAGTPLTREEMTKLFERHDRLWKKASEASELAWNDFPWPMARMPTGPDDITYALVNAYMQSPHWPDKEKSKKTKDRIKDQMKKWHPDRFETKYLPRVQDKWKETVKQGAGIVTRHLGDLLRKENEGNLLFGE